MIKTNMLKLKKLLVVMVALFSVFGQNAVVHAAEQTTDIFAENDIAIENFENDGLQYKETVDLGNGITCEVFEKIETTRKNVFLTANRSTTKTVTNNFRLWVNNDCAGYLRQITSWSIDGSSRPNLLSHDDAWYSYDLNKYDVQDRGKSVKNYKQSARQYTNKLTLKMNGTAVGTTEFSTIMDKTGNASFTAIDV